MTIIWNYVFLIFYIIINIIDKSYEKPLLLILLYDGFRNDYLDRGLTPTLTNFKYNGVHADYLKTVYPPIAGACLFTICTGLFPIRHGFQMRPDLLSGREQGKIVKTLQQDGIPIWVLNQRNGGISGCMMWMLTDINPCSLNIPYDKSMTLRARADQIITWLKLGVNQRPNLVLFYVEQLDRITHFFGPMSRNSSLMIKRLDLLTKYIINKLIEIEIYELTNIIILSDHGMRAVGPEAEIALKFEPDSIPVDGDSIDDVNGRVTMLLNPEIMADYKTNVDKFTDQAQETGQYEIVQITPGETSLINSMDYAACPGFVFYLSNWQSDKYNSKYASVYSTLEAPKGANGPFGVHGYLRQNDAIFMAKGPKFAAFKKIEPFEMVDLFSAFTRILDIQGDFERDGNFSRVLPIFIERNTIHWLIIILIIFALAVTATSFFYLSVEYLLRS